MLNLPFLKNRQRKFLISIGDDGAVLVYLNAGQLEGRFYFADTTSLEIERVFASDPDAPIYVLADVSDQSYAQQALPPVSSFNVKKLVERRLVKDYDKNDIKGALLIDRSDTGRRDWNYMFVSIRNAPPFSAWMEVLQKLPNRIAGIYLLPVEAEGFMRDLKKAVVAENAAKPSQWQMMISHNKVGGLRQIILKKGRIAFTRMAQPVGGTSPGVVAGNIEQEIINTIEFMRRFGYEPDAGLDVMVITSADVKRQIEPSRLGASAVFVVTPHEVAGQLGLEGATEAKDKFADVVMLAYIGLKAKPVLKLTTPLLTRIEQYIYGRIGLRLFAYLFVPLALLLAITNAATGFGLGSDIERAEKEATRAAKVLKDIQTRSDALAERKKLAADLLTLYDRLSSEAVVPFNFFGRMDAVKGEQAMLRDLRFAVTQTVDKAGKPSPNSVAVNMNLEVPRQAGNPQALLQFSKEFRQAIEKEFAPLTISFGGLPGDQDFSMSVEGGPTPAQAPPPQPNANQPTLVRVSIGGAVPEEMRRRLFQLHPEEGATQDKVQATSEGFVPVQKTAAPSAKAPKPPAKTPKKEAKP